MRRLLSGVTISLGVVFGAVLLAGAAAATSGECTVFYNHSGHIPGSYDYAEFYEDGQLVTTVETFGEDVFVNPAGWDAGESWDQVNKCVQETTTTTEAVTTSTEGSESTTSSLGSTTTTVTEESTTTTTIPAGTTTPTISSSTTPTTQPVATTSVPIDTPELPFTGPAGVVGLLIAGFAAVGIGSVLVREFRSE